MKVLIMNDEGAFSSGAIALAKMLAYKHQVAVVAPEGRFKGGGHSFTINSSVLRVKQFDFLNNVKLYAVNGTPCDCLALALDCILKSKPDVIITGIDYDQNLGNTIFSSGNVSGAIEGTLNGIPSICVSYITDNSASQEKDFYAPARFIKQNLEKLVKKITPGITLNINIPVGFNKRKIVWTRIADGAIKTNYKKEVNSFGDEYFWLDTRRLGFPLWVLEQDADLGWVKKGFITITPLKHDLTNYEINNQLKKVNFEL